MPADGTSAATKIEKGTSARPFSSSQSRLHRLPVSNKERIGCLDAKRRFCARQQREILNLVEGCCIAAMCVRWTLRSGASSDAMCQRSDCSNGGLLRIGSQIDDSLRFACRALYLTRLSDCDLNAYTDCVSNVGHEELTLRCSRICIGVARPCFRSHAHAVEASVAAQFDDEMWPEALAPQYLFFNLCWKDIDAADDEHVVRSAKNFLHSTHGAHLSRQ